MDGELDACQRTFEKIVIAPYSYEGNRTSKPLSEKIEVRAPASHDDIAFRSIKQLVNVLGRHFFYFINEFFVEKVYTRSYWLKSWVSSVLKTKFLLKSDLYEYLVNIPGKDNTVLYFYWGNNQALIIPFLKSLGFKKIIVRFHGFDLYKERLGGYQPFRRQLLSSITLAAPISEYGARYLGKEYGDIDFNSKILRLGVKNIGRSKKSKDDWLRLVSCARVIKLKRIDLVARVLKQLPYNIEWTHIGDGDYLQDVKEELIDSPGNFRATLLGWFSPGKVPEFYRDRRVDIFISLSASEGIPVSVMEALAAGIPVFSTRVGGISEIIDHEVGRLVEPDLAEHDYIDHLKAFIEQYSLKADDFREAAYKRFQECCSESYWNESLVQEMM